MAWCHRARNHDQSHCWPIPMSSYAITSPKWVNELVLSSKSWLRPSCCKKLHYSLTVQSQFGPHIPEKPSMCQVPGPGLVGCGLCMYMCIDGAQLKILSFMWQPFPHYGGGVVTYVIISSAKKCHDHFLWDIQILKSESVFSSVSYCMSLLSNYFSFFCKFISCKLLPSEI